MNSNSIQLGKRDGTGESWLVQAVVVVRRCIVMNKVTYRGLYSEYLLGTEPISEVYQKMFQRVQCRDEYRYMVAKCMGAKNKGPGDVASVPHRSPRNVACKSRGNAGID